MANTRWIILLLCCTAWGLLGGTRGVFGKTPSSAPEETIANVLDFGADPTGAVNSTSAILAAVKSKRNVYLPKGEYVVTGAITLQSGQRIYGDGRTQSILLVDPAQFDRSALGVITLGSNETGASASDLGILFHDGAPNPQERLATRPTALYASNPDYSSQNPTVSAPARFQVDRVRVSAARICLDARGNAGGAFINDFECGAYAYGMLWDGTLDWVHIKGYHFWPFGMPTNTPERNAFDSANAVAASFGKLDGLQAVDISSFRGRIEFTENASNSCCDINFTDLALDSDGAALDIARGSERISINGLSAIKGGSRSIISASGGHTTISNLHLRSFSSAEAISVSGGFVQIVGGLVTQNLAEKVGISNGTLAAVNSGLLEFRGVQFSAGPGMVTGGLLTQSGNGALVITNSSFLPMGRGLAALYKADNRMNVFRDNILGQGWDYLLPQRLTRDCGIGAKIAKNSTDHAGVVSVGTGTTGCVLPFSSHWASAPSCVVVSRKGVLLSYSITASELKVWNENLSGTEFDYRCEPLAGTSP